jgi:hypothetical protein
VLAAALHPHKVIEALLDTPTGDSLFAFNGGYILHVFNFSAYEVWELSFPEGTAEYSNYAK